MGRGKTGLDSTDYDYHLTQKAKQGSYYSRDARRELRQRHLDRRNANKGYEGYHFGIGDRPVHTKNKEEFKKELEKRGLMLRDDVKNPLR